jgi:hypothetical protein
MDVTEKLLMLVLGITTILGLYWGFFDPDFFTNRYMMEDGEIENATVVLLLASCMLVAYRWTRLRRVRPYQFSMISLLIVIAFFFVAGEELSWGQRIFGLETTEYFKENNAQAELNLHNLTVGEVKINKLVFGLILTTVILIYMVLVPVLYQKMRKFKELLDSWYIPVPRLRHSASYLVLMLLISVIPASKNWELLEFGSVLVFFLILWSPVNRHLFRITTG